MYTYYIYIHIRTYTHTHTLHTHILNTRRAVLKVIEGQILGPECPFPGREGAKSRLRVAYIYIYVTEGVFMAQ